jgi:hypothetical protein
MDGHVGLGVSEDDAIGCVPDSLFTFLNLVYGGQDILVTILCNVFLSALTIFPFSW